MQTEANEFSAFMAILDAAEPEVTEEGEEGSEDTSQEPMSEFQKLMNEDNEGSSDKDEEEDDSEEESDEDDSEDEDEDDEDLEEDDSEEEEDSEEDSGGVDVDFDTVITLPNGMELTIEELTNGYKSGKEIQEHNDTFEAEKAELATVKADATKRIELSKLEAEKVIEEFRGFDWQKLANENPEQFANTKLFVEKYIERKAEIESEFIKIEAEKEKEKATEYKESIRVCVANLQETMPEWNQQLYVEILKHGVLDLGIDEEWMKQCTDPGVIKAVHTSLKSKNSAESVKAKVTKKVKAPVKTAKSTKKEVKVTKKTSAKTYNPQNENDEFSFFKTALKG